MMAFSGVRSSWVMFARNCDLCWLASASWLALLLDRREQPGVVDRQPTGRRTSGAARRPRVGKAPGVVRATTRPPRPVLAQDRHRQHRAVPVGQQLARPARNQLGASARSSIWTARG